MNLQNVKTIHMMGIGGIGMGTLASMLKEEGFRVVGSDRQQLYPPMSTHLESLRIPIHHGYKAENLQECYPDLVIVGNHIRRDNPEAQFVLQNGIPYLSMPQAIRCFFLSDHDSIVVTGTHGKSTTSALLAWMLTRAGRDPSAFVGAFLKDWERGFRLGKGRYMVIEGDEYDTAFFDKGPKFFHYRPHIGVITSIEYDHADMFPDLEAVLEAFRAFVRLIPSEGYFITNADDPHCLDLVRECKGNVVTYGSSDEAQWRLLTTTDRPREIHFRYKSPFSHDQMMVTKLPGLHNLSNTLAVLAVASTIGLSCKESQQGLLTFPGIKRRQDVLGERNGILIIDDFAHHPTAVRGTIEALRGYYPERRLIAVFEPRSNTSRRRVFQDQFATAFDQADRVCIKQPPDIEGISEEERLDARQLVRDICQRHKEGVYFENTENLLSYLLNHSCPGDLILCMSNGSFDHLPRRLLESIPVLAKSVRRRCQ
jgi:UDP-N-acetylmuramate: L-alanyl-gamma-D-glutamyl-meso-diaminopimelate ligase